MDILVVDDDRDGAALSELSTDVEPAQAGQHHVQHHQIRPPALGQGQCLLAGVGQDRTMALFAEAVADDVGDVAVILLTARGEEADRVWGLDLGADDYLTKPFSHRELLARIRAVARRSSAARTPDQGSVMVGDLEIDFGGHEVSMRGVQVDLTPKEYAILHCLALNAGRVVPHERVLTFAWGSAALESDVDQLKVHVRHLREKLERNPSAPEYLTTVRGVGYKLAAPRETFTV